MSDRRQELDEMLGDCSDPSEIWTGRVAGKVLRDEYAAWVVQLAAWSVMVTLTFREERYPDVARRLFLKLVQALNQDVLGKQYKRVVKHSYFSYVVATEYQLRGVIHFHFLADRPLNFRLLHDLWNAWAGFALAEVIRDPERAVRYVAKYLVKGDEPEIWIVKKRIVPLVTPPWWKEFGGSPICGGGEPEGGGVGPGRGSTA